MSSLLQQLNSELSSVVEGVGKSLVQVRNGRGAGAGTIWHSDGLIITNAHVAQSESLQVILQDGKTLPARILAYDQELDLTALSVEAEDLPAISLGESSALHPGQFVVAMGNPWGITGAVTSGVVIGVGAELPDMQPSGREWVAVSLHLRPGYSGGPLLDAEGRLVGINTMMTGPDIGMAVPVHVVKKFLQEKLGSA